MKKFKAVKMQTVQGWGVQDQKGNLVFAGYSDEASEMARNLNCPIMSRTEVPKFYEKVEIINEMLRTF